MIVILFILLLVGLWYFRSTTEQSPVETHQECEDGTIWSPVTKTCNNPVSICPPGYHSGSGKPPCMKCAEGFPCPKPLIA